MYLEEKRNKTCHWGLACWTWGLRPDCLGLRPVWEDTQTNWLTALRLLSGPLPKKGKGRERGEGGGLSRPKVVRGFGLKRGPLELQKNIFLLVNVIRFLLFKQVRIHNRISRERWAGASMEVRSPFVLNSTIKKKRATNRWTKGPTDGWTDPNIE